MNKFKEHFNPEVHRLTENYRSSTAVLEAANKIIPDAEYVQGTIKPGVFELFSFENQATEAQWVVDKVVSLVELSKHGEIEGIINFEKIAILARNKYLFNELEPKLGEKNIPFYYKMTPGPVKFESVAMQMFELCLRLKLNPQDVLHRQQLATLVNNTNSDLQPIQNLVDSLSSDGSNLKNSLEDYKSKLTIEDENEKNMIFNDIQELLKHWHNYARKTDSTSLHQFRNAMALGQTHPLSQHNGLTLSTVHTMKGQEFDIVFIIGLDDASFPDYRAINKGGIELTQEKNNLYVAFTRSKRWLYATWPKSRTMPWGGTKNRTISRFLNDFEYTNLDV
jgi:DNA helicase-2/ATP-dependent DNA helicase PcrA